MALTLLRGDVANRDLSRHADRLAEWPVLAGSIDLYIHRVCCRRQGNVNQRLFPVVVEHIRRRLIERRVDNDTWSERLVEVRNLPWHSDDLGRILRRRPDLCRALERYARELDAELASLGIVDQQLIDFALAALYIALLATAPKDDFDVLRAEARRLSRAV